MLRLLPFALTGEESRGLGGHEETDGEDESKDNGETDWESPRNVTGVVRHTEGRAVDEEDTEGDAHLERTGDQTSEGGRSGFRLENGDKTRGSTDTETGKESTDTDLTVSLESRSLDGNTSNVDADINDTGCSGTNSRGQHTGAKGTDESTDGQDTGDGGLSDGRKIEYPVSTFNTEPFDVGGHNVKSGSRRLLPTEEQSSERLEKTQHYGCF